MYSCQLASVDLYNFLHMNASHIQLARSCLEFIFVISLRTLFCRTLRTLASQPKGCLRLRDHPQVIPALQVTKTQKRWYHHTLNYSTKTEILLYHHTLNYSTKAQMCRYMYHHNLNYSTKAQIPRYDHTLNYLTKKKIYQFHHHTLNYSTKTQILWYHHILNYSTKAQICRYHHILNYRTKTQSFWSQQK